MTTNEMMKMLLEIEDGRKPTPGEVEAIQKFITDVSAQFAKITELMIDAYAMLARNLLDWWESIPVPVREQLMSLSNAPLQERREALPSLIDNMPTYLGVDPSRHNHTAMFMNEVMVNVNPPSPIQFPDQTAIMSAEAERRNKFRL